MYPKFNLFSNYEQFNHLHAPKYFDWVKDGTGEINFFVDDYVKTHNNINNGKPKVALLIEPRTIQPTIYEWMEEHWEEFDWIFTHDDVIVGYDNALPINFMQWYKSYDVPKTKVISMVCSDKSLCNEHEERKKLADLLGNKVDHYGTYKGGYKCDYYECRAEYMFEVVVDNNWTGHWISEKLANPIMSHTIPIFLGGKILPDDVYSEGMIIVNSIDEIPGVVDEILKDPEKMYSKYIKYANLNYKNTLNNHQTFEDWFWTKYKSVLEELCND